MDYHHLREQLQQLHFEPATISCPKTSVQHSKCEKLWMAETLLDVGRHGFAMPKKMWICDGERKEVTKAGFTVGRKKQKDGTESRRGDG